MVSYDPTLGGWPKRTLDVFLSVFTAPVWAPVLAVALAWTRLRNGTLGLVSEERVGYGGRAFRCLSLRAAPCGAVVTPLHPGKDETPDAPPLAVTKDGKLSRVIERLPQMINVLHGDMSLIGPRPLARETLDPLKTAKRYYLSTRPGVIGIAAVADTNAEEANQYKIYTLSWSLLTDALIAWDALMRLKGADDAVRPSVLRVEAPPPPKPHVLGDRKKNDAA
ncbi:MAG: sugar transferase [Terricaulis sp.]